MLFKTEIKILHLFSGAARFFSRGPKFFEPHSPGEKPSRSGHNRDMEAFSAGDEECARFLNRS